MAPLLLTLRDASATEPDAAEVWRDISDRPAANIRKLAQDLDAAGGLRAIDEAADVIWASNRSELYVLLIVERRWPPDRHERWLADTWCRLLVRDTCPSSQGQREVLTRAGFTPRAAGEECGEPRPSPKEPSP